MGIDAQAQRLLHPVEDQQRVRQHEIDEGDPQLVLRGGRHGRLDPGDVLVADVADGPAGEARHARQLDRPVAGDLLLDQGQGIARGGDASAAAGPGARISVVFGPQAMTIRGPAADEAVAVEVLAALDRLQEVGRAVRPELGVGRDRASRSPPSGPRRPG